MKAVPPIPFAIFSIDITTTSADIEGPIAANIAYNKFVNAIKIPDTNIAVMTPDLIANNPPIKVNITVVSHPKPLE